MGYKCDMCSSEDAQVFCFADNAVMCRGCDQRVHNANKLAKKHERVSLQPEAESTTCDICQEHKAVMFCSEDRALICRRCDIMIHTANEFVSKHHRYLLSGVSVGLKALDGPDTQESDDGKSRRPYSLRNTTPAVKNGESWGGAERNSWRSSATAEPTVPSGLGASDPYGSQPSLINLRNPASGTGIGGGGLQNATSIVTPFGRQEEQFTETSPSTSPSNHQNGASSSGAAFNGWGGEALGGGMRPNSSDFTLAAELLGMPSVANGFSAKDIDAAYIFDEEGDLDANLSALLEVPDLDAFQLDNPTLINHSFTKPGGAITGEKRLSPLDGVVPDLNADSGPSAKRQHI